MRIIVSGFVASALALMLVCAIPAAGVRASGGEYYYNAGRRVPLIRSATRVALRAPDDAARSGIVERAAASPSVRAVRDVGAGGVVELTLSDAAAKAPSNDVAELGRDLHADLLPVFYEPGAERDASTLFISDEVLVQFAPGVARARIDAMNASLGAEIVEPLAYAPNGFRLKVLGSGLDRNALTVANAFYESGLCRFAHPNFLAHRVLCFAPNDPQYPLQWHLHNTGQGGGTAGADVSAEQAWDITRGSSSITIAIADTGIDYHHEDFNVTVGGLAKVRDPRDVVHGDNDPAPQTSDPGYQHGTATSGVATAAFDNGLDTAGIAPGCRLMPIQLYAESTFTPNSTEADAFTWAADHGADVMSNSWAPDNDDTPLPDATRAGIDYATTTGRGGRGLVIFFAAGNENNDTIHNTYCSYSGVIAVAASTNQDLKASYSNFGQAVSIAAPSSGGSLGITTTDVTGQAGYSTTNVTNSFGGTSSASPLAAGVAALVLSANPDLSWQEVKQVLEQSADKIDPGGGAYDASGRSPFYGYGRVNAFQAVTLAQSIGAGPHVSFQPSSAPIGAGASFAISWTIFDNAAVTSQMLEYSTDGGATFAPIAAPAADVRSFTWAVPETLSGTVTLRLTATDSDGNTASSTATATVWARPSIERVKLKKSASGKLSLVVDGAALRVREAVIFVNDTPLGALKYPRGRQLGDGSTTRVVSKDARIKTLIPAGTTVSVTIRHPTTGQVSAAMTFTRQ